MYDLVDNIAADMSNFMKMDIPEDDRLSRMSGNPLIPTTVTPKRPESRGGMTSSPAPTQMKAKDSLTPMSAQELLAMDKGIRPESDDEDNEVLFAAE